jgi:hypothetical protein
MLKSFEKFSKDVQKGSVIEYKIPIKDLENLYKYFHISGNYLIENDDDKTFIFTAKVPLEPFTDDNMDVIEDDFTPRVSIAPSIKMCLRAISGEYQYYFLYGVDLKNNSSDDIEVINLKNMLDSCPIIYDKRYGEDFNLVEWLEALDIKQYREIQKYFYKKTVEDVPDIEGEVKYDDIDLSVFIVSPSDLPEKYKKLFYACVPDADTTNEFWSLKNLKMDYLGILYGWHDEYVTLQVKEGDGIPKVIKNLKQFEQFEH